MMAKGLFRLWCVLTAIWVALMVHQPNQYRWEFDFSVILNPALWTPPLIILAIGTGLVWAARGFRA